MTLPNSKNALAKQQQFLQRRAVGPRPQIDHALIPGGNENTVLAQGGLQHQRKYSESPNSAFLMGMYNS